MRVRVFYHDKCFDGACSAALFSRFYRERIRSEVDFIFTGLVYGIAFATLAYYFLLTLQIKEFYVLATCMLPVTVYFFIWAARVWKDIGQANFVNTMRMNLLASICINTAFIIIFLMH